MIEDVTNNEKKHSYIGQLLDALLLAKARKYQRDKIAADVRYAGNDICGAL